MEAPVETLAGRKRKYEEEEEERSTDGSDDGADLDGFIAEDEDVEDEEEIDDEDEEILPVVEVTGTVVGGRVLRDRTAMKPVERYFDTETYKKIMEQDEARDMLTLLKKWNASGEVPSAVSLTKKSPFAEILAEYKRAKTVLDLSDTSDDEEDEEEEDDDDEEDEESEEDDEESEEDDEESEE